MGDPTANEFGFSSRAAALLKNGTFSDVDIQVIDGSNFKSFKAHKLILAMGSKVFGEIFFDKSESPNVYKILDFHPRTVYLMLKYLYSNKLNLDDIDKIEARELYSLSKRYGIKSLQELCVNYISQNEIDKDNVLLMYDCALREKFMNLLANCRKIVSLDTKAVFESPFFVEVSLAVLEDIVQLENLSVDDEFDIIYAAVRWARYECRRQKLSEDDSNLHKCLRPLLRHIRKSCNSLSSFIKPDSSTMDSNENLIQKKCPVSKVYPLVQKTAYQTFDFPLQEVKKHFSTAFNNDVKCSVFINSHKDVILIHGLTLKINQKPDAKELVYVILKISSLEGNSSESSTFDIELKDGILPLTFNHLIKVSKSDPVEIEVTIEDLKLNRCCIIKYPICELTSGSEIIADVSVTCNQMNESGHYFFLINSLNYSVV